MTDEQSKKIRGFVKNFPFLADVVNRPRARLIRWLRVDCGCTYGAVAHECWRIWGEGIDSAWDSLPGNQLAGDELCWVAAVLLDEDPEKKPWN